MKRELIMSAILRMEPVILRIKTAILRTKSGILRTRPAILMASAALVASAILIIMPLAFAQPELNYTRTFGGTSSDTGGSIRSTADGGYVLTGMTTSYGEGKGDLWLMKVNSQGMAAWNKTFGGTSFDIGRSVIQARDGGYLVGGATKSYGAGNLDAWLIKVDSSGSMLWNRTFGEKGPEECTALLESEDGSVLLAGYTGSHSQEDNDVILIKTSSNGTELWNRTFSHGNDHCWSVSSTDDGGYILAGSTDSYDSNANGPDADGNETDPLGGSIESNQDVWVIKTDSKGNLMWDRVLSRPETDDGRSITQASDGGYILTGYANARLFDDSPRSEVLLAKLYSNGTLAWIKTFGGAGRDEGYSVLETSDRGYVIAGYTTSSDPSGDALLAKTDSSGTVKWIESLGGQGTQSSDSVQSAANEGYMIAGYGYRTGGYDMDIWLARVG